MMVVLDTDADYLLLADGRLRRVESPKRKKRKQGRVVSHGQEELARRLREGAKLSNSDVRRALQEWQQPTIAE